MQTISTYSTAYTDSTVNSNKKPAVRKANASRKDRAIERLLLRLAAASLFFVLLFVGLTIVKGHADSDLPAVPAAGEQTIVVGAGDTLWDIASSVRKEGEDIRRTVYDLQKRNNLSSSSLRAGQTLIVPADDRE
ncbi:LysM peptidoglycan-binding domain-containing protein [Paenibacillus sp. MWE-103]|uniref:LysM peptidoglycan-binding domain-containing protein n=1 Tax=Paenibacillus artemisiicola TaxID=1172618 RepID=A0ABS3WD53_9BACL|nr:LysM peptidoglycan-binding domain-containing protein [Paenibacillus artemisiicola]MBO7746051.1 LysM peptidoglycan-binding domain-containing protein [Paenibacillus artemisiicola]